MLIQAMRDGVELLTWQSDTFAYAESFDEAAGRYRGLRAGKMVTIGIDDAGLLVKPSVARAQFDAEAPEVVPPQPSKPENGETGEGRGGAPKQPERLLRRFFGTVRLDPTRTGRDAARIADEVISHLLGQEGAEVSATLEIQASLPKGASDQTVRTVTENSRTLKFETHGFESE